WLSSSIRDAVRESPDETLARFVGLSVYYLTTWSLSSVIRRAAWRCSDSVSRGRDHRCSQNSPKTFRPTHPPAQRTIANDAAAGLLRVRTAGRTLRRSGKSPWPALRVDPRYRQ